jgi:hypothetical protein
MQHIHLCDELDFINKVVTSKIIAISKPYHTFIIYPALVYINKPEMKFPRHIKQLFRGL